MERKIMTVSYVFRPIIGVIVKIFGKFIDRSQYICDKSPYSLP